MAGRPKAGANNDLKAQYGMWLGLPRDSREPSTQAAFGEKIGKSEKTLIEWQDDPIVVEAKQNAIKVFLGNDKLDIMRVVCEKAKGGSWQHARLFLEWQGEIGIMARDTSKDKPKKMKVEVSIQENHEDSPVMLSRPKPEDETGEDNV